MKPRLIYHPDYHSNVQSPYLEPYFKEQFECISLNNVSTRVGTDVYYGDWRSAKKWITPYATQAVIDHTWDPWVDDYQNYNTIRSDGWFCIANEALDYYYREYHKLDMTPIRTHSFLMLINYKKQHREQIWERIQPYLKNALYSYVGHRVFLDNDVIKNKGWGWDTRYTDISWYNKTKYSLVVETDVAPNELHSEKILKPCAFKHPFICWGPPNYLKKLRSWGFETFDNCIDESYDLEQDHKKRLAMIINEVARLNSTVGDYFDSDQETQRRINHNFERFYNIEWAESSIRNNLIDTIKQYSNSW